MPGKVLFALTSHDRYDHSSDQTGYWLEELTHFWHEIASAGYSVDFVSPKGGEPPLDRKSGSSKDPCNQAFLANAVLQAAIRATAVPTQVDASAYCAMYFVGGHGAMWDFPDDKGLNALAQAIYAANGTLCAVCHGVAGLLNLRRPDGRYLVEGQSVTGFSNFEEGLIRRKANVPFLLEDELKRRGGAYQKALLPFTATVAKGERLLTGQNPQSTRALGRAFVQTMRDLPKRGRPDRATTLSDER